MEDQSAMLKLDLRIRICGESECQGFLELLFEVLYVWQSHCQIDWLDYAK